MNWESRIFVFKDEIISMVELSLGDSGCGFADHYLTLLESRELSSDL